MQLIQTLIAEMRDQPVLAPELDLAKESIINSFVFAFEDKHDVVVRRLHLDLFGYPEDYMQTFRERIAAVTIEDVQRAARLYLRPADLQIVLVGDSREFGAPPSILGVPLQQE